MAGKRKYYVVWEGNNPGIYDSWQECKRQVEGYEHAKYKSFATLEEATKAFRSSYREYYGKKAAPALSSEELQRIGRPLIPSICVDAA
ncbi:MAG: RNase H1/viroplasmin domain-containing protein, partial [Bacteroidales bacterium]|nr:RNase H1/viroplasmin domain-containing protein [Bacteroidales bacterium]